MYKIYYFLLKIIAPLLQCFYYSYEYIRMKSRPWWNPSGVWKKSFRKLNCNLIWRFFFLFRKSRSPGKRTSRSPSRSPGRSGDENDWVNNNENTSSVNTAASGTGTGNTTFIQQQKSIRAEREEEKRRLQAEMRRRESELLAKIKAQQRELESMKQEKGKVCNTFLNGYGNVFLNSF